MTEKSRDKGVVVNSKFSAVLYRFRGYILGLLAVALVAAPPSLLPKPFEFDECAAGFLMAIPLFVASAVLRVLARQFIGEHTRGKVHDADKLVTVGVYSRIRHPLYVSNTGFAIGFTFLHLGVSLWVVPFTLAVVLFEVVLARIEDRFLENKFGKTWRKWASATPAFFPHFIKLPSYRPQRSFWQAFFADRSTWLWLLFCNLVLILRKVVFYV